MNLLRSEQRNMHRQVDKVRDNFHTIMQDPAVEEVFGNATAFLDVSRDFYVPNVRHGTVTAPRKYHPDRNPHGLPILIGDSNQTYYVDGSLLPPTPTQIDSMHQTFQSWGADKKTIDRSLGAITVRAQSGIVLSQQGNMTASVNAMLTPAEKVSQNIGIRQFRGRPVTTLWSKTGEVKFDDQSFAELDLLHEVIHIGQFLAGPIRNPSAETRDRTIYSHELAAYSAEALAALSLYRGSSNPRYKENTALIDYASGAIVINDLRLVENKNHKDLFKPTGKLIKQIEEMGLDIV